MPELPEVETVRRILEPIVKGKTIRGIRVLRAKNILTGAKAFVSALTGETFLGVSRMGKFLIFHLSHGKVVVSHLRMEGKYFEGKAGEAPAKHDVLIYDFTDGTSLRYNDVRKFGVLLLKSEQDYKTTLPLSKLGKEPWDLSAEELFQGLKAKKKEPIKEALLDQTLIAGLGNIYDDEVLYASKINPKLPASKVSKEQCLTLKKEAERILDEAIEAGGSTIRSYHPKEGVSGEMQNELLAYGQRGKPCSRCGFPLRKIAIGGRGTVYCPICQALPGKPLLVAITGPIASGKSTVAKYLAGKGYAIIDADEIVRKLYKKEALQAALALLFGPSIIKRGRVNHAAILTEICKDNEKKEALNRLIHPLVYAEIEKRISKSKAKKIAIDIPLLIGSPLEDEVDLIIDVVASPKVQIARLVERGKDPEKSLALNKGWPRGKAKNAAGLILSGDGSVADLKKQLEEADYL
jgi:formamidopyrimidine-DNA glycosylase